MAMSAWTSSDGISQISNRRVKERHPLGTRAFEGMEQAQFRRFVAQSARRRRVFSIEDCKLAGKGAGMQLQVCKNCLSKRG